MKRVRQKYGLMARVGCACIWYGVAAVGGCGVIFPQLNPTNPFTDLPAIALDGKAVDLTADIVPLGELATDRVIRVLVEGESVRSVLILIADEQSVDSGVIAGGGPANEAFDYRIGREGRYFVFVRFDPSVAQSERVGTITVDDGDPNFSPAPQIVQLIFDPQFLTNPGLFDPQDGTPEELEFLEGISTLIMEDVTARVQAIFEGTPIQIVSADEDVTGQTVSRVFFMPDRVLAEDQDFFDAAQPAPDPTRPQCQQRVIFGEVLPRGVDVDLGNQILDDDAAVYVGSFQGRGRECWTAIINSVNNVVLSISHTAAHEIGHLVGLEHVEQIDIMNRTATIAFFRELEFQRGQIQVDRQVNGEIVTEVLTTVIQDPAIYFETAFAQP